MIEDFCPFRKQTAGDMLIMLATVMAIASLLIRQYNDADVWWHIAIGRDILANISVPDRNFFTTAGWGRDYHDSHWLFQVVLASADRLGGSRAVGAVSLAIWSATFLCCYRSIRRWLPTSASCVLLFIAAVACNSRFMPRPDIVSCFMIALFYLRLQSGRYTTILDLAMFGVLQIIWSNSHGLFVIGPFMAGCYVVEAIWDAFRGRQAAPKQSIWLLVVLLIATLLTPFGIDGWRYALQIAQEAGPQAHIIYKDLEELRPIFHFDMLSNPDCVAFFLILAIAAVAIIPTGLIRKLSIARLLMFVALLVVAAASGRRNIPLFSLAAIPLIAESIRVLRPEITLGKAVTYTAAILLLCFTSLPLSGRYYQWFKYEPLRFGIGAPAEYQPSGLPAFLRQINFSGQIYNNDLFGGYCLYYGILPLVDGRWEVYDQEELTTILRAPFDQASWEWVVNRYNIRGALVRNGEIATHALVTRFISDGSFQLVYQDKVSSFWLRRPDIGIVP
jgi:hypothetical protein